MCDHTQRFASLQRTLQRFLHRCRIKCAEAFVQHHRPGSLPQRARQERGSTFSLVLMEMGLGNQEKALALLQSAYAAREEFLLNLVDPIYDPLRNDPRFVEILHGVGLTR